MYRPENRKTKLPTRRRHGYGACYDFVGERVKSFISLLYSVHYIYIIIIYNIIVHKMYCAVRHTSKLCNANAANATADDDVMQRRGGKATTASAENDTCCQTRWRSCRSRRRRRLRHCRVPLAFIDRPSSLYVFVQ